METFVQSKNISLHDKENNSQQLIDLKLFDEATNVQYIIKVQKEVYNRAHNGITIIIIHILIIVIINIIFVTKSEGYWNNYISCILILLLLFFIDMIFATTLLQKAKTLFNSKDTYNSASPKNMMANDISKHIKTVVLNGY